MSERSNRIDFVVQKYRLAEQTLVEAEENGRKLGLGRVMAEETLQRFVDGDPSGNNKYLDWMLFQAGGGQEMIEKSIQLWEGENESDPNSLRNQCRADFLKEQTEGYTDDNSVRHLSVSQVQAIANWKAWEPRSRFEFIMGDQDVALEEGYGFWRHWPGKNGVYAKIVSAVKLWHMAQPKLLAQNQRFERFTRLTRTSRCQLSHEDRQFVEKCQETPLPPLVVLDLYSGWRPKEYSQPSAVYRNVGDLLRTLADVHKLQILRDVRFEKIYEDEQLLALCPLTVGAAIKFGIGKWCVSNKTEFDRSFESRAHSLSAPLPEVNWYKYNRIGPLVFMCWKVPMPAYLHKLALHIDRKKLRGLDGTWNDVNWFDCMNQQVAIAYPEVQHRVKREAGHDSQFFFPATNSDGIGHVSAEESYYKWGGREPGQAWTNPQTAIQVLSTLSKCLEAVQIWATRFDPDRVVLDYVTDVGAVVGVTTQVSPGTGR